MKPENLILGQKYINVDRLTNNAVYMCVNTKETPSNETDKSNRILVIVESNNSKDLGRKVIKYKKNPFFWKGFRPI